MVWLRSWDEREQAWYYHHADSGESSWEEPAEGWIDDADDALVQDTARSLASDVDIRCALRAHSTETNVATQ